MELKDLTSLHAWIDKKGLLHYLVFDEQGNCVGNDEWKDAGRALKEIRASFPDEFAALRGKERVDTFLRAVTAENATSANPAQLWIHAASIDLSGTLDAPLDVNPATQEVNYHDFSF